MPAHTSLTGPGKRVAKVIKRLGYVPHPGPIDPKRTRGHARVTVTAERSRVRIVATGEGIQDVYLYGSVDHQSVVRALSGEFGEDNVAVRDPFNLWTDG